MVIESWLNELSTNETRGAVFSAYTLITLTVMAAGQQLLLLYDPREMALFALASALVSLAAIPVVLSVARVPEHEETETRLDLRRLFRISPAGALGSLSAGLSNGSFGRSPQRWLPGTNITQPFSSSASSSTMLIVMWFGGAVRVQYE